MNNQASYPNVPVQALDVDSRAGFITKTYFHLFGAILIFTFLEYGLFASGYAYTIAKALMGVSWLLVLGGFMVISWLASRVAHTAESKAMQYFVLGLFILAEAIIFVPLLVMADMMSAQAGHGSIIASAAYVTLAGFASLTAVVFVTRKDFSFLGVFLKWAFIFALGAIVLAVIFKFDLGFFFSLGMVVLAGGAILYDTSNVLHHYQEDRYVAAALQLFASVALMFWYVLRIFMSRR